MRPLFILAASMCMACVGASPSGGGKPFVFGWGPGEVSIEESVERDGEVLTLVWKARLEAERGRLRMTFSEPQLSEGFTAALGPGGSHPFYQVMPDLLIDPKTGALLGIERTREALEAHGRMGLEKKTDERSFGAVKTQEEVAARARTRWESWTRLVGFEQKANTTSEDRQTIDLEDGQKMPVVTTTSHSSDGAHSVVKVVRTFSGAKVTEIYKEVIASTGASPDEVAAVEKVIREEHYEATLEPRTTRPTTVRKRELTTEHSRGDRVKMHAASEAWTFVW